MVKVTPFFSHLAITVPGVLTLDQNPAPIPFFGGKPSKKTHHEAPLHSHPLNHPYSLGLLDSLRRRGKDINAKPS